MNDKPGSAERRPDPEMKRGSKQCCEVQKCLPTCFLFSNMFLHLSTASLAWEGSKGNEAPVLQGFSLQKRRNETIALEEASHGHPMSWGNVVHTCIYGEKKRHGTAR